MTEPYMTLGGDLESILGGIFDVDISAEGSDISAEGSDISAEGSDISAEGSDVTDILEDIHVGGDEDDNAAADESLNALLEEDIPQEKGTEEIMNGGSINALLEQREGSKEDNITYENADTLSEVTFEGGFFESSDDLSDIEGGFFFSDAEPEKQQEASGGTETNELKKLAEELIEAIRDL